MVTEGGIENQSTTRTAGAGRLEVRKDDQEWAHETLGKMTFTADVSDRGGECAVVISVMLGGEKAATLIGRHSFSMSSDAAPENRVGAGSSSVSVEELKEEFGISVNAERLFLGDTPAEWRFRLIHDDGETYVGGVSMEDHWQSSHSHRSYTEVSTLFRGTLVLVTRDSEHPSWIKVEAVTALGEGIPGEDCPVRRIFFTYDAETGAIVEEVVAVESMGGAVFLQTEIEKAHNVYLSKDAIVASVRKPAAELPAGAVDRVQEDGFDAVLNGASKKNGRPTHMEILDIINSSR